MNNQLLFDLCSLDGVSGREHSVREFILKKLNESSAPKGITVDAMGNILVHLIGKAPASKTVLFDAHMDEVGFLITHVNSDGTLCFDTVGGIDKSVLFGQRVRIGKLSGVIGGKAIHQCAKDEKESIPAIESMCIDIGVTDREAAQRLVEIGQGGTFATDLQEWKHGIVVGKALDDRVGCALLLALADEQPKRDIWLSFSVQEEVGLRGAKVVAEVVKPEIAVAIDATTAADIAGSNEKTCVCCLGAGPVVSFADGATLYDQELYQTVRSLAEENGIVTQTKNRIAGGNNGASLQRGHTGARTVAISLPCRYIHSPSCMGDLADVDMMKKLLKILVEELTK